jgi:hypothetical protein
MNSAILCGSILALAAIVWWRLFDYAFGVPDPDDEAYYVPPSPEPMRRELRGPGPEGRDRIR